ncbi:RNA polymerase sigma factor [Candidatus Uabimicrobium sp. HlEnr_7]|uniref:RNA polymerase sigma factor n=1 Tax=Candidatus Uabimicrobium helgolandensis TaxID=3095367 RepID=UPI0035565719
MSLHNKRTTEYYRLVDKYANDLYKFAYRMCGDSEAAEDILQETFYEAWRSLDSLKDKNKIKAWLFQIMRYRYAHWVRDKVRHSKVNLSLDQIENTLALPDPNILKSLSDKEILQKALGGLDDRYKEPFLLVFLQSFSCKEAAEHLGIPLGTVLSRIHRARVFLRKSVNKLMNTEQK